MKKKITSYLSIGLFVLLLSSCRGEDDFTGSIFVDPELEDPTSATYEFNNWLQENYLIPYNLEFLYKMQDVGSDLDYNLVPTSLEKSRKMAILIKYLWFDVYGKVVSEDFLKDYGPRIIHLIGSPAYNPTLGTIVLGTAEGGLKVTLYRCNELDLNNVDMMNEFYFKTMHHEFAHILHQKRTYPKEYEVFSAGYYDPQAWQNKTDSEAASLGFVSPYAGSQPREDFVEVIANYIVKSNAEWAAILELASKPGVNKEGKIVDDPLKGDELIAKKLAIATKWLKDSWGIEIQALRDEVQERQKHINELFEDE